MRKHDQFLENAERGILCSFTSLNLCMKAMTFGASSCFLSLSLKCRFSSCWRRMALYSSASASASCSCNGGPQSRDGHYWGAKCFLFTGEAQGACSGGRRANRMNRERGDARTGDVALIPQCRRAVVTSPVPCPVHRTGFTHSSVGQECHVKQPH